MAREYRVASSSFDELAVGLSSGTLSRGKAIKLMGAALLGGVLAFTPKVADAFPIHNPHKCNSAGECTTGTCCAGTCCGEGAKGGVTCIPAAPACQQGGRHKGRVGTLCATTTEGETTCLSGCGTYESCSTTADCNAIPLSRGMVCAVVPGRSDSVCVSPCRKGG